MKEPPQLKRLKTKVRNPENRLAGSVPKDELESLKTRLEGEIADLEAKLTGSIPREETEALRARLKEFGGEAR